MTAMRDVGGMIVGVWWVCWLVLRYAAGATAHETIRFVRKKVLHG